MKKKEVEFEVNCFCALCGGFSGTDWSRVKKQKKRNHENASECIQHLKGEIFRARVAIASLRADIVLGRLPKTYAVKTSNR